MSGLGTIANALAIIGGTLIGVVLRRGLPEKWQQTIMQGVALCIFVIGLQMALKTGNIVICVVSLVIGSIIGEALDIDGHLQWLGNYLANKFYRGADGSVAAKIAEGFISATLIFCIGAMAVVGALQDGLKQDATILYAKATLDGIISVILAANLGIGVAFSSVSVFLYQGSLTMLAGFLQPVMTEAVLNEVTACGGVLIMAIGINSLKLLEIRISNQLPAVLVAGVLAYYFIYGGRTLENVNLIMQNYLFVIILVLLVLLLVLFKMYSSQSKKLAALQKKYDFFTQGDDKNWDEILTQTLTEVRAAKAELDELEQRHQAMREQMKGCVQKVKLMRYNAFSDTGSNLSYSLAVLDENNNGVVLSSLYGREDNRSYAKPVENGKSTYQLSDEEKDVLEQVMR